ncbi:MAG: pyridoxal phosphate-dependent aminotransferase [Candidatus Lokiarchaeota archaeon]|nr:pyridoxal phosphate-dependent aminotransferase [Candidatus Lokiarchaeota archaeon]
MKELSTKIRNAPKSKIRELFDLAAGRSDVISLGIGQPDFPTPQPAIEGNINALNKKFTYYAPTRGIPELLQQLENKLKTVNNIDTIWKDNIMLANGGSQALSLTFASIFNPGDEIIINSPNFISYFYLSSFFDLKVIEIERKNDFSPDIEKIKDSISEKTKAILINSPNNPTGYSLDPNELEEIVEIVKNNDLYLISDEVYENYLYDGNKHTSPASLKDMFERTITINAMSKLYSATGFRLGYVAANKEIIDTMEKYHQYTVAGTNHAAQYGFLEALKMDNSFFNDILKNFDERRLLAYNRLSEMGFEVVKPKGAFYIMPKINNSKLTGAEFSKRVMKDQAVAIVPGNVFGSYSEYMLRMSYATKLEKLEEAMNRIEKFMRKI